MTVTCLGGGAGGILSLYFPQILFCMTIYIYLYRLYAPLPNLLQPFPHPTQTYLHPTYYKQQYNPQKAYISFINHRIPNDSDKFFWGGEQVGFSYSIFPKYCFV